MTFDYIAKSGKQRIQSLVEPEVGDVVAALKRRRGGGPELLAYRSGSGWVDVKSQDINAHLRELSGGDFSAKDFRTWSATVLAAVGLAVSTDAVSSVTARKRAVTRVVQEVAHYLGNTPAVCRSSYIDPRIIDLFDQGITIAKDLQLLGDGTAYGQPATQGAVEAAVLRLLRAPTRRRASRLSVSPRRTGPRTLGFGCEALWRRCRGCGPAGHGCPCAGGGPADRADLARQPDPRCTTPRAPVATARA